MMFNRLQWRLTVSYMVVTLAAMVLVAWWVLIALTLRDAPAGEMMPALLGAPRDVLLTLRGLLWPWAVVLVIPAMGVSGLFGFITARWVAHRLDVVSAATSAWSRGDFTAEVGDTADDEIGRLGRRLNRMADQLEELVARQHTLATLEERNRLARDLHDSVKQQVFAAVMQIGAAKALIAHQPEQAAAHLAEAEALGRAAQKELANLILELGPTHLEERPFAEAVRAYLAEWERQNAIGVEARIEAVPRLGFPVEQALFRFVQEALANVAKHSGAAVVRVRVGQRAGRARVVVADDGCGFDEGQVKAGHGLDNMRERIAGVGGRFTLETSTQTGTQVAAEVDI